MSSPNLSFKTEYYGIRGLTLGLSGYFGKTQSTLYSGIHEEDVNALAIADSSVVGINMLGLDSRYLSNGFQFRTQFYYAFLSNTSEYIAFTANHTHSTNDLGNSIIGYYAEIGFDILHSKKTSKKLIPFIRHSYWDTHFSVSDELNRNAAYKRNSITTGISLVLSRGSVFKADSQWIRSGTDNEWRNTLNLGIGFMF
jgi:hypothetical protein